MQRHVPHVLDSDNSNNKNNEDDINDAIKYWNRTQHPLHTDDHEESSNPTASRPAVVVADQQQQHCNNTSYDIELSTRMHMPQEPHGYDVHHIQPFINGDGKMYVNGSYRNDNNNLQISTRRWPPLDHIEWSTTTGSSVQSPMTIPPEFGNEDNDKSPRPSSPYQARNPPPPLWWPPPPPPSPQVLMQQHDPSSSRVEGIIEDNASNEVRSVTPEESTYSTLQLEDHSLSLAPGPTPDGTLDGGSLVDFPYRIPPRRPTADEDSVDREAPSNSHTPRPPAESEPQCGQHPTVEDSHPENTSGMEPDQHQWGPGHKEAQRMYAKEKPPRDTRPLLHSGPNNLKVVVLTHSSRQLLDSQRQDQMPHPIRWDEGSGSEPKPSLSSVNMRGPTTVGSSVGDFHHDQFDLVGALRDRSISTDGHSGTYTHTPWLQPVASKNETSGPHPLSDYVQVRRRPKEPPVLPLVEEERQRQDEPQDQEETFVWWEYMMASGVEFATLYGKDIVLAVSVAANIAVGINQFLLA